MTDSKLWKSYYLYLLTSLLTGIAANSTSRDEIWEDSGVANNIRDLANRFKHLSLQQKLKIKEWSSEKTLEENLAAYDVTEMVKDMNLQQCVIVEIGEGFCSLFVERRDETGYSCNGSTSSTQELFLGVCECSEIHGWRFCSAQLEEERSEACSFNEATSMQENSARVHRRLCDISQMIQWNACNCSHAINDQILLQTEGFPSCYRAPISQSVCYPRSVCGRNRCTPTLLASNIRSVTCDPQCPGGEPFCEHPVFATSVAPQVNSTWSEWGEPECNATCSEGFLISQAVCIDKQSGNCAQDCIGPWKSCCPKKLAPCACRVDVVDGALVASRILGSCTASVDQDRLQSQAAEKCTKKSRNNTSEREKCSGGKLLGTELVQKMMVSLAGNFKLIPGIQGNGLLKENKKGKQSKLGMRVEKERTAVEGPSREHRTKRLRSLPRKRRHNRIVSKRKHCLRRLLRWRKRDGEYEYFDEAAALETCKRDCLPTKKPDDFYEEDAEMEVEYADQPTESTVEEAAETEGILVTDKVQALSTAKPVAPQEQTKDIDEEEVEEDTGQEQESRDGKSDQGSQEMPEDSEFDFLAISEAPVITEKGGEESVNSETPKKPKVLVEKKKSGKGIGHHKSRIKGPEFPEGEEGEEEVEQDPGGKRESEEVASHAKAEAGSEEMLAEDALIDDDVAGINEVDPNLAPKEATTKPESNSSAGLHPVSLMLVLGAAIAPQITRFYCGR